MKYFSVFPLLTLLVMACGTTGPEKSNLQRAELILSSDKEVVLPFLFDIKNDTFSVHNGEEVLDFPITQKGDTHIVQLNPYNASLEFWGKEGRWNEYDKSRSTPLRIVESGTRFGRRNSTPNPLQSRYKVTFGEGEKSYPAIAEFEVDGDNVTGTFLTETGDYRYLAGLMSGENLQLSAFDGAHAFLFTARITSNGEIHQGVFYSGPNYKTTWKGEPNDTFQLKDAGSITQHLPDSGNFNLTLNDPTQGKIDITNPMFDNKVTVIQVLGTWCPNCRDETELLLELYDTYSKQGLGVVGVAYEFSDNPEAALQRISNYRETLAIDYPILYGGYADKEKVTDDFYTLNQIISFPTLIVLDSEKEVQYIHTGFSGPATSQYPLDTAHIKETIATLLN